MKWKTIVVLVVIAVVAIVVVEAVTGGGVSHSFMASGSIKYP